MLDITTIEQRVVNNNYRSRLALIVSDDIKTSHLLANYLEEYYTYDINSKVTKILVTHWYLVDISIRVSNLWIPLMLDML